MSCIYAHCKQGGACMYPRADGSRCSLIEPAPSPQPEMPEGWAPHFSGYRHIREWTAAELLAEKPRGEVLVRTRDGQLCEGFICHGCQQCWPEDEGDEEAYPHFLSWKALVEVTV